MDANDGKNEAQTRKKQRPKQKKLKEKRERERESERVRELESLRQTPLAILHFILSHFCLSSSVPVNWVPSMPFHTHSARYNQAMNIFSLTCLC